MALAGKRLCRTSLMLLLVVVFDATFGASCFIASAENEVDLPWPLSDIPAVQTGPTVKSPAAPNVVATQMDPNNKPTIWRDARLLITLANGSEKVEIDSLSLAIPPRLGLSPTPIANGNSGANGNIDYYVIAQPTALEPGTQITYP